jgi:tetratricopeptide (TPR) repeat protein
VRAYDDALAVGDHQDVYLARGRVLETLGRDEEAANGYAAGLHAHAGAVVLRDALIRVELRRGNHERALAEIDQAMAQARIRTRWLLLRGEVLAAAGRSREAQAAREEALREADRALARRDSPANHVERGRALLALGRAEEAIRELEQALRRVPRLPEAQSALAAARRQLGGAR